MGLARVETGDGVNKYIEFDEMNRVTLTSSLVVERDTDNDETNGRRWAGHATACAP